jgi:hypothetical protein
VPARVRGRGRGGRRAGRDGGHGGRVAVDLEVHLVVDAAEVPAPVTTPPQAARIVRIIATCAGVKVPRTPLGCFGALRSIAVPEAWQDRTCGLFVSGR